MKRVYKGNHWTPQERKAWARRWLTGDETQAEVAALAGCDPMTITRWAAKYRREIECDLEREG